MKNVISSFRLIIRRKDSLFVIIISTLLFLLLLVLVQNGATALSVLSFQSVPVFKRIGISLGALFDITNTFSNGAIILAALGSFVGGVNISLAYTYIRLRGEVILHSGLYHGVGLILAFLGIGCAACGTAFLSVILGFFGFSAMLQLLPYQGQEIGYVGLLFLCIATYSLSQKVSAPNVC